VSNASQVGRGFIGRHDDLWYFERLPHTARKALADAAFNWSAGALHSARRRGKRGFKTGPDIAARIAEPTPGRSTKIESACGASIRNSWLWARARSWPRLSRRRCQENALSAQASIPQKQVTQLHQ
jgi:hypothetical protein